MGLRDHKPLGWWHVGGGRPRPRLGVAAVAASRRVPPTSDAGARVPFVLYPDPAIGPFLSCIRRRGGVDRGGGGGGRVGGRRDSLGARCGACGGGSRAGLAGVRSWHDTPALPATPPNGHDEGRGGREACGERAEWTGWTGAAGGSRSLAAPRRRVAVAAPGGARALAAVAVWGNGVARRRGCRALKATTLSLHLRRALPLGGTDSALRVQKRLVGDRLRSDATVLSWSSSSSYPRLISFAMGTEDRQNGCCGGSGGPSCIYCTRLGFPDSQRGVAGELWGGVRAVGRCEGGRPVRSDLPVCLGGGGPCGTRTGLTAVAGRTVG